MRKLVLNGPPAVGNRGVDDDEDPLFAAQEERGKTGCLGRNLSVSGGVLQCQNLNGLGHAYFLPHEELREYAAHLLEASGDFVSLLRPGIGDDEEMRGTDLQPFRLAGLQRKRQEQ